MFLFDCHLIIRDEVVKVQYSFGLVEMVVDNSIHVRVMVTLLQSTLYENKFE